MTVTVDDVLKLIDDRLKETEEFLNPYKTNLCIAEKDYFETCKETLEWLKNRILDLQEQSDA